MVAHRACLSSPHDSFGRLLPSAFALILAFGYTAEATAGAISSIGPPTSPAPHSPGSGTVGPGTTVADLDRNGPPGYVGNDPPLIIDGGWQEFSWIGAPGTFNVEGAFTFVSSFSTRLLVTDAFLDGDQFRVFDNDHLIGTTSMPSNDGADSGAAPDAAFGDSRWSSGTFLLGPGAHAITIETIATATENDSGAGYLQAQTLESTVPEPATVALLATGVVSMIGYGWRRQKAG